MLKLLYQCRTYMVHSFLRFLTFPFSEHLYYIIFFFTWNCKNSNIKIDSTVISAVDDR